MTTAMRLREEGLKQGELLGIKKGKIEIARKMKQKGFEINLISELAGLSKEEIERL